MSSFKGIPLYQLFCSERENNDHYFQEGDKFYRIGDFLSRRCSSSWPEFQKNILHYYSGSNLSPIPIDKYRSFHDVIGFFLRSYDHRRINNGYLFTVLSLLNEDRSGIGKVSFGSRDYRVIFRKNSSDDIVFDLELGKGLSSYTTFTFEDRGSSSLTLSKEWIKDSIIRSLKMSLTPVNIFIDEELIYRRSEDGSSEIRIYIGEKSFMISHSGPSHTFEDLLNYGLFLNHENHEEEEEEEGGRRGVLDHVEVREKISGSGRSDDTLTITISDFPIVILRNDDDVNNNNENNQRTTIHYDFYISLPPNTFVNPERTRIIIASRDNEDGKEEEGEENTTMKEIQYFKRAIVGIIDKCLQLPHNGGLCSFSKLITKYVENHVKNMEVRDEIINYLDNNVKERVHGLEKHLIHESAGYLCPKMNSIFTTEFIPYFTKNNHWSLIRTNEERFDEFFNGGYTCLLGSDDIVRTWKIPLIRYKRIVIYETGKEEDDGIKIIHHPFITYVFVIVKNLKDLVHYGKGSEKESEDEGEDLHLHPEKLISSSNSWVREVCDHLIPYTYPVDSEEDREFCSWTEEFTETTTKYFFLVDKTLTRYAYNLILMARHLDNKVLSLRPEGYRLGNYFDDRGSSLFFFSSKIATILDQYILLMVEDEDKFESGVLMDDEIVSGGFWRLIERLFLFLYNLLIRFESSSYEKIDMSYDFEELNRFTKWFSFKVDQTPEHNRIILEKLRTMTHNYRDLVVESFQTMMGLCESSLKNVSSHRHLILPGGVDPFLPESLIDIAYDEQLIDNEEDRKITIERLSSITRTICSHVNIGYFGVLTVISSLRSAIISIIMKNKEVSRMLFWLIQSLSEEDKTLQYLIPIINVVDDFTLRGELPEPSLRKLFLDSIFSVNHQVPPLNEIIYDEMCSSIIYHVLPILPKVDLGKVNQNFEDGKVKTYFLSDLIDVFVPLRTKLVEGDRNDRGDDDDFFLSIDEISRTVKSRGPWFEKVVNNIHLGGKKMIPIYLKQNYSYHFCEILISFLFQLKPMLDSRELEILVGEIPESGGLNGIQIVRRGEEEEGGGGTVLEDFLSLIENFPKLVDLSTDPNFELLIVERKNQKLIFDKELVFAFGSQPHEVQNTRYTVVFSESDFGNYVSSVLIPLLDGLLPLFLKKENIILNGTPIGIYEIKTTDLHHDESTEIKLIKTDIQLPSWILLNSIPWRKTNRVNIGVELEDPYWTNGKLFYIGGNSIRITKENNVDLGFDTEEVETMRSWFKDSQEEEEEQLPPSSPPRPSSSPRSSSPPRPSSIRDVENKLESSPSSSSSLSPSRSSPSKLPFEVFVPDERVIIPISSTQEEQPEPEPSSSSILPEIVLPPPEEEEQNDIVPSSSLKESEPIISSPPPSSSSSSSLVKKVEGKRADTTSHVKKRGVAKPPIPTTTTTRPKSSTTKPPIPIVNKSKPKPPSTTMKPKSLSTTLSTLSTLPTLPTSSTSSTTTPTGPKSVSFKTPLDERFPFSKKLPVTTKLPTPTKSPIISMKPSSEKRVSKPVVPKYVPTLPGSRKPSTTSSSKATQTSSSQTSGSSGRNKIKLKPPVPVFSSKSKPKPAPSSKK